MSKYFSLSYRNAEVVVGNDVRPSWERPRGYSGVLLDERGYIVTNCIHIS